MHGLRESITCVSLFFCSIFGNATIVRVNERSSGSYINCDNFFVSFF